LRFRNSADGAVRASNWILNGATVVLVVCAVLVTGLRLRDALAVSKPNAVAASEAAPNRLATTRVRNWRTYAEAGHRMGPESATVTIVEFSDFQCPFCRRAAPTLRALRVRYPHNVAVIYRHFPGHQFSLRAAIAAECAGRAGYFEPFHDALFAQADSIGKKPWSRFAREVGMRDTVGFSTCLSDASVPPLVFRDTLAATMLSVHGTPTFLINDLEVTGYREAELVAYVTAAMGEARVSR
jgi:protein-disulfide isomerase